MNASIYVWSFLIGWWLMEALRGELIPSIMLVIALVGLGTSLWIKLNIGWKG